jgi:hypothetical protein
MPKHVFYDLFYAIIMSTMIQETTKNVSAIGNQLINS